MKNYVKMLVVMLVVLFLGGCAALYPAAQIAVGTAQIAYSLIPASDNKDATATATTASTPQPKPDMGVEIGRHQINQYNVRVTNITNNNETGVSFTVYENDNIIKTVAYKNDNGPGSKKIKGYTDRTSEVDKKKYLRMLFLWRYNFDLGPIEEPPSEVADTKPTPSVSSSYIPTTSFVPKVR